MFEQCADVLKHFEEIQAELLDYKGSGMSVMEMSHRSKVFQQIADEAEADLRKLMNIPDNYKVLFVQGGATLEFAMIPMNLKKNGVFDYIVTGAWSKKAANEAKKYGKVNVIATSVSHDVDGTEVVFSEFAVFEVDGRDGVVDEGLDVVLHQVMGRVGL